MPATDDFIRGNEEALKQFRAMMNDVDLTNDFVNPFTPGTEEYRGFEAACYTLVQK